MYDLLINLANVLPKLWSSTNKVILWTARFSMSKRGGLRLTKWARDFFTYDMYLWIFFDFLVILFFFSVRQPDRDWSLPQRYRLSEIFPFKRGIGKAWSHHDLSLTSKYGHGKPCGFTFPHAWESSPNFFGPHCPIAKGAKLLFWSRESALSLFMLKHIWILQVEHT